MAAGLAPESFRRKPRGHGALALKGAADKAVHGHFKGHSLRGARRGP
jgi:hypothetical protein